MNAVVNHKGQVTIPKKLRDELGFEPGTAIEFEVTKDKRILMSKADRSPFTRIRGRASIKLGTEEIMKLMRN
ncbi:AbrB family looped-hinge helix DNA binding protein [Parvibaculum indicum]|uniref:AbrB/MazE/SpoVT family DNA-binding domain-containing protein n=1 Tax=Parvibaculum indicum TaxID=562969 RepID=UPI00141FA895|nr:AbrB/MazE/SpoVT family DNA-binding domain-containing protein [Parvibaculum indicum]NIJ41187.1 AbrB family looped-hinge helix DNA binding protein [Parvibaculum indicum]